MRVHKAVYGIQPTGDEQNPKASSDRSRRKDRIRKSMMDKDIDSRRRAPGHPHTISASAARRQQTRTDSDTTARPPAISLIVKASSCGLCMAYVQHSIGPCS